MHEAQLARGFEEAAADERVRRARGGVLAEAGELRGRRQRCATAEDGDALRERDGRLAQTPDPMSHHVLDRVTA